MEHWSSTMEQENQVQWRRDTVQELCSKRYSQREISQVLQVGLATVNRDNRIWGIKLKPISKDTLTEADSQDAQIAASGNKVYVTWWERNQNQTSEEPVMRVSNDNGKTFRPLLRLASNGTIGWG